IKVATSTISDYERNRRLSPGVSVIKRFVNALIAIDKRKGGTVLHSLLNITLKSNIEEPFYKIKDFNAPLSGVDFARIIDGKIISNASYLDSINLFGYTLLDSLRVILEIAPQEYPKLFGMTTERAFIFKNVSTGRSPMVVIRVAPIKPKIVVILGLSTVDKLAIKLSQVEKIPLITSKINEEELIARLSKI
ncbi:MAG: hypothetical protein QXY21_02110, partial [Candidatus Micrarchaeaceae archaeon]